MAIEKQEFQATMNGKRYKLILTVLEGKIAKWVRVRREMDGGEFEWAFLSARQHKAESQFLAMFAAEIKAFEKLVRG